MAFTDDSQTWYRTTDVQYVHMHVCVFLQVWQGLVKEMAFEKFMIEDCRTIEHAQQILAQHKVPHYWDAAKNFIPGESVPVQLVTIAGTE